MPKIVLCLKDDIWCISNRGRDCFVPSPNDSTPRKCCQHGKNIDVIGDLDCEEYDEEDPDCIMYEIALSIIDVQNFQIQTMRGLLDAFGYPATDDCVVNAEA